VTVEELAGHVGRTVRAYSGRDGDPGVVLHVLSVVDTPYGPVARVSFGSGPPSDGGPGIVVPGWVLANVEEQE
jgi:hypothetical protein